MIFLIGLIIVAIVIMVTHDPSTRYCRWRKDRSRDADGQRFWICDYCGAQRLTSGEKPSGCANS